MWLGSGDRGACLGLLCHKVKCRVRPGRVEQGSDFMQLELTAGWRACRLREDGILDEGGGSGEGRRVK